MSEPDYGKMTGAQVREMCRCGAWNGPTCGMARGHVQANLVILPVRFADDFERFCLLNPRPCPLLEVGEPGVFEPKTLAPGADVRSDLPRYRVYRKGACVDRPTSIERYADARSVFFLLGCSFTFESALLEASLPVRHLEEGCNVPMYRTNIVCNGVGAFAGPLIVSMRPMTRQQAEIAAEVTARFPRMHGAPIHIGDPEAIGIHDLDRPEYGDRVTVRPDEVPVFWACGVTPMAAIVASQLDLAITHEPGHMFVTDALERDFRDRAST